MIRNTQNNYYLALGFDHHDPGKHHMTLMYYRSLTAAQLGQLVSGWDDTLMSNPKYDFQPFRMTLAMEGWFGPENTIRALQPTSDMPNWVKGFSTPYTDLGEWVPHVVTKEEPPWRVTVNRLVLMRRKCTIASWVME